MVIFQLPDLKSIPAVAKWLLKNFHSERIFAFYGEMGAGKTTIIKEMCRQLGVSEDQMSSPSFALINEYRTKKNETIYHFDFYRIKKEEEVFDLGYEDYFYSGNYCFIEWAERVRNMLPEGCVKVEIKMDGERRRMMAHK